MRSAESVGLAGTGGIYVHEVDIQLMLGVRHSAACHCV